MESRGDGAEAQRARDAERGCADPADARDGPAKSVADGIGERFEVAAGCVCDAFAEVLADFLTDLC